MCSKRDVKDYIRKRYSEIALKGSGSCRRIPATARATAATAASL